MVSDIVKLRLVELKFDFIRIFELVSLPHNIFVSSIVLPSGLIDAFGKATREHIEVIRPRLLNLGLDRDRNEALHYS